MGLDVGDCIGDVGGRGVEVVALEPNRSMAALARRKCRAFSAVRVELTSFEDWPLDPGGFGLVYSAQAWHWVSSHVRGPKAAEALAPGGTLALFWNRTDWKGETLRDDLEAIYRRLAPDLLARAPGFPGLTPTRSDEAQAAEITGSSQFEGVSVRTYPWSAVLTTEGFVDVLLTQSNHRLLPEDERSGLVEGLRGVIEAHGGRVVVPHATFLVLAHRR